MTMEQYWLGKTKLSDQPVMLSKSCYRFLIYNLFVTGFVKRGLPHTSSSMKLEDCNLDLKVHKNLKFSHLLTNVDTHCYPNFKAMTVLI